MFINNLREELFEDNKSICNKIDSQLILLEKQIDSQKEKKSIVFENYNTIFTNVIQTHSKEWEELFSNAKATFENSTSNITNLELLESKLMEIKKLVIEARGYQESSERHRLFEKINYKLEEYSGLETKLNYVIIDNTNDIEIFNKNVATKIKQITYKENLNTNFNYTPKSNYVVNEEKTTKKDEYSINKVFGEKSIEEETKKIFEVEANIKNRTSSKDNRTLVVSEKDKKVYLPYSISDLEIELKNSKYKTIEELIKKEYIVDIKRFNHSSMSRFKESYNLIRNKEKGSKLRATTLGFEMMFNYRVNPAVIAACRNEDELDIFLDCLEDNELDDFKIFDIKYELMPRVKRTQEW